MKVIYCLFAFSYFILLQLENLTNFIKATTTYGLKPHDIFEANDLFENGNMTQVQTTLLALAGMAKTKGIHSSVDIGVKYAERQERAFDEEKMKAGQCVIGLQMGTNKCASQAGMNAYGTRRHLYDPKSHILPPMDHSTISLQMGTNKGASQVTGMNAYGTRRHLYDPKSHILPPMDHSTISLQMGTNKGASQVSSTLPVSLVYIVIFVMYCMGQNYRFFFCQKSLGY
uniref:Calponin-2 n=1 Tax=Cyprinus carpio TaxID=7962 RepID=A0A8C1S5K0_CYPCA